MRVVFLQHVAFEGPGRLMKFFKPRHDVTICHLYLGDSMPELDDFDWLIVLGGPMGVHDDDRFHWISGEKKLIRAAVDSGRRVLGICLGAQLIASVLGAEVTKNSRREIGWFPVECAPDLLTTPLGGILPEVFEAFHWHGDTFAMPKGALPIGSTEACANQGFILNDRIAAFQFHLESTPESVDLLLRHCGSELDGSSHVQNSEHIRGTRNQYERLHELQDRVLRYLSGASSDL